MTRCPNKSKDGRFQCQGVAGHVSKCFVGGVLLESFDEHAQDANKYHQSLGAKWMLEAIIKEYRTTYRLNKHAIEFAKDLERQYKEDPEFWRPEKNKES
jgi:hypothetical protein